MKKLSFMTFIFGFVLAMNSSYAQNFQVESNGDIRINGSIKGKFEDNGDIRVNGSIKGKIESNGDVRKNGSIVGSSHGASPREAAVMYFFEFF